jgi:hypothetical protein
MMYETLDPESKTWNIDKFHFLRNYINYMFYILSHRWMELVVDQKKRLEMKTIKQLLNTQDPIDKQILALMNANKLNVDLIELEP